MTNEYCQALAEVSEILKYTKKEVGACAGFGFGV